jgi:hypothetical protein
MVDDFVLQTKADELASILNVDLRNELLRANTNRWTGMMLMILAILASVFAGLGGFSANWERRL